MTPTTNEPQPPVMTWPAAKPQAIPDHKYTPMATSKAASGAVGTPAATDPLFTADELLSLHKAITAMALDGSSTANRLKTAAGILAMIQRAAGEHLQVIHEGQLHPLRVMSWPEVAPPAKPAPAVK